MGEVRIRGAEQQDIAAIRDIYALNVETGTASYELVAPSHSEMIDRFQAIHGKGYPYLVAEQGNKIIGYAYASPFRTRPAYRWLVEDSVYIHEDAQGKGVGRMLLRALIEACVELGFRQMVAVIGGAHPASVALHQSCGFRSAGRLEATGYKFGNWLDTEMMQLALGEGNTTSPAQDRFPGTLA
ncbi:MAG: N-acetyltransferase family protein [Rhizobiaceae bacterium]